MNHREHADRITEIWPTAWARVFLACPAGRLFLYLQRNKQSQQMEETL